MITQFKTSKVTWPLAATLLAWLLPVFAWAPLTYPGYFEFHSGFLPIFNLNDLMRHLADLAWPPTVGQPYDLLRGEGALAYRLGSAAAPAGIFTGCSREVDVRPQPAGWCAGDVRLGAAQAGAVAGPVGRDGLHLLADPVGHDLRSRCVRRGGHHGPGAVGAVGDRCGSNRLSTAGRSAWPWDSAAALWTQAGLALWLAVIVFAYILLVSHRLKSAGGSGIDSPSAASQRRLNPTGLALIGWTGGLVLGILGLLPVVTQHGFGDATYVNFTDHFVYPFQLLLAGWGIGPSIPGPDDTLTFSLGIAAFGLAVLGIVLSRQDIQIGTHTGEATSIPTFRHPHTRFALAVVLILAVLERHPGRALVARGCRSWRAR